MYIISPITVFDEDKELFETHIGLDDEARTLLLSAWGKTEEESNLCAAGTIKRLNVNVEENAIEERIEAAKNYLMGEAEQLYCDGPVYSESGYRYNEVIKAIQIATGIVNNPSEKQ